MPVMASKTIYLTADGSRVVDEGDADAAFLLARAGTAIDDATAQQYGISGEQPPVYDAVADHAEKHGGATPAQAAAARQDMLAGVPDPDGPAVEGERADVKAQRAPSANKAKAPAAHT